MQHQINFLDSLCGKTCQEPFQATAETISEPSSKRSAACVSREFQFLDLRKECGNLLGAYWETATALPGVSMTLNTGESPNVARESTLSQILEANAPEKYYLSPRACQGILNRAKRRGKALPEMLREALEETIALDSTKTPAQKREVSDVSGGGRQHSERNIPEALCTGRVQCLNPRDSQSIRQYDANGVHPALTASNSAGQDRHGVCYCLQGNGIDRADTAECNGNGYRENQSYTLNTIDRPAVAFGIDCQGGKSNAGYVQDGTPTLCSDSHGTPHAVCFQQKQRDERRAE